MENGGDAQVIFFMGNSRADKWVRAHERESPGMEST